MPNSPVYQDGTHDTLISDQWLAQRLTTFTEPDNNRTPRIIVVLALIMVGLSLPLLLAFGQAFLLSGSALLLPRIITLSIASLAGLIVVAVTTYLLTHQKNYQPTQWQDAQNPVWVTHPGLSRSYRFMRTSLQVIDKVSKQNETARPGYLHGRVRNQLAHHIWKRYVFYEYLADGCMAIGLLFFAVFLVIQKVF